MKTYVNPDGSQVRVTQEMKNVEGDPFKVHLNNLIGKNQEYFDHLGGNFFFILIILLFFFLIKENASVECVFVGDANALKKISRQIILGEITQNTKQIIFLINV